MNYSKILNEIEDLKYNLTVSGLTTAVEKKEVVANVVAAAATLNRLGAPQMGYFADTIVEIPILSSTVKFNNDGCDSEENSATLVEPRFVNMKLLASRDKMCVQKLSRALPKILSPGQHQEDLPFANVYLDLKSKEAGKELERMAYLSNPTFYSGATDNLGKTTGWVTIAESETSALAYYGTYTAVTLSLIEDEIIAKIPKHLFTEEVYVNVANSDFTQLLKLANREYGNGANAVQVLNSEGVSSGVKAFKWPGYDNVIIAATHGLIDPNTNVGYGIFATNDMNLGFYTNAERDIDADLFYDKASKKLISDIVMAAGFQYEHPENVIFLKKV